jgi:uncharacterized protein DUF6590
MAYPMILHTVWLKNLHMGPLRIKWPKQKNRTPSKANLCLTRLSMKVGNLQRRTNLSSILNEGPGYRVYRSNKWTPGTVGRLVSRGSSRIADMSKQVFKIYWSEPMGSNGAYSVSNKQVYPGEYGLAFYTGFRRFVVVASDEGNSTCV